MKNVAKCDTWCELQNPVNHRVFERKLRPKPLGRGHVCMGVTHRVAPTSTACPRARAARRGADVGLPCLAARLAQKRSPPRGTHGKWWLIKRPSRPAVRQIPRGIPRVTLTARPRRPARKWRPPTAAPRPRPHVRRDYPLSLSISISGGKETYKDSPSNGERTGNSPA